MDEGWKGGRRTTKRADERELTEGSGRGVEGRREERRKDGKMGVMRVEKGKRVGDIVGAVVRVQVERLWKDTKEWEEQERKRYRYERKESDE